MQDVQKGNTGNRRRGRAEEKVADVGFGIELLGTFWVKILFWGFWRFWGIFFLYELIQLLHGYVVATKICAKGGLRNCFLQAVMTIIERGSRFQQKKLDKTCVILEFSAVEERYKKEREERREQREK